MSRKSTLCLLSTSFLLLILLLILPICAFSAQPASPILSVSINGEGTVDPDGGVFKKNNMVTLTAYPDPSQFPMSADSSVMGYLDAGVPLAKINLGLPFYGRGWASVPDTSDGLYQPAGRIPRGKWEKGIEDFKILKDSGFASYWDDLAQAAWLYNGNEFWTYDNEQSIASKMAYVQEQGLGGIMFCT